MIEVKIKYIHKLTPVTKNDYYIFPSFIVKGHANNGESSLDCVKVCAGITACVVGIKRLLDDSQYDVIYRKGYFEIKAKFGLRQPHCDMDTCYALNTLWCQLYDIYLMFPSQFKSFEIEEIELKENEKIYAKNTKPKPFKQLGIPSHQKRLHRKTHRHFHLD